MSCRVSSRGRRSGKNGVVDSPWAVWLPRDFLRVAGPDAVTYLQGQLSQDVAALGVGGSAWSLLLEPQGKVDALVRVTRTAEEEIVLLTLYAKAATDNLTGAKLKEIRRVLES